MRNKKAAALETSESGEAPDGMPDGMPGGGFGGSFDGDLTNVTANGYHLYVNGEKAL